MPVELQPLHLLLIMAVELIVFGPQRLPEIGRGLGRTLTEFRRGLDGLGDNRRGELEAPDGPAAPDTAPAAPMAGNFCIQCGRPNPPAARFCHQCGALMPED